MADDDEVARLLLEQLHEKLEHEYVGLFLEDAQSIIALLTAACDENSEGVGIIMDAHCCCVGHMGGLLLCVMMLTKSVLEDLMEEKGDLEIADYLQEQGILLARMVEENNA